MPSANEGGTDLAEIRERLHRQQVYLGAALAAFGVAMLVAVGLLGLYGLRLSRTIAETESRLAELNERSDAGARELSELAKAIARQEQELLAIRQAANVELEAMREANRKLESVRDPANELSALREANAALWQELASQRAQLLRSLDSRVDPAKAAPPPSPAPPSAPVPRFRLGETRYAPPETPAEEIKGFVKGGEKVFRASVPPPSPAVLVIEVDPSEVALGEPYRLSVRLVNESNRVLVPRAMRLDWSFRGRNTGGDVPVEVKQVEAKRMAVLYAVSGQWTESHQASPVSVTVSVTLDDGARVTNALSW
jgi:hypothetical protein